MAKRLSWPMAAAVQYWQARILCKLPVLKRKLTHHENRSAIGLDLSRMTAVPAETGFWANRFRSNPAVIELRRHAGPPSASLLQPIVY